MHLHTCSPRTRDISAGQKFIRTTEKLAGADDKPVRKMGYYPGVFPGAPLKVATRQLLPTHAGIFLAAHAYPSAPMGT